ncbi:MAG: hypothetical protein C0592_09010 [Marinilabiliales bacterium]|nr:MAG: hypothetical protein C0592_09010 [Marinilabiliales bacterium]
MKNENKNHMIDQVSRDKLNDLHMEAPDLYFKKIRKRVAWYSVFVLGVSSFIRSYWFVGIATLVVLFGGRYFLLHNALSETVFAENRTTEYTNCVLPQPSNSVDEKSISNQNNANNKFAYNIPAKNSYDKNVSEPDNSKNQFVEIVNVPKDIENDSDIGQPNKTKVNIVSVNQILALDEIGAKADLSGPKRIPLISSFLDQNYLVMPVVLDELNDERGKPLFSAALSLGGGFSSPISDYESEYDLSRSNSISALMIPEISMRIEFKKFFISSGLRFLNIYDRYHEGELLYNEHLTESYDLLQQFWTVDTSSYWHYTYVSDSVIHVSDSVWVTEYDSTLIQQFDTSLVNAYDTLHGAKWSRTSTVFEIPIMIGHKFTFGNQALSLSGGFGTSLLLNTKGKFYNGLYATEPYTEISNESKSLGFTLLLNMEYEYFIHERMSIQIQPWFRKKIYETGSGSENDFQGDFSAGISGGFRIYF